MTWKSAFFESWSWFKFNNLGLARVTNLKFYSNVANGLRLKVRKFLELIQFWIGSNEECFKWLEIWFLTVPIELKGEYHWQTRQLFSDWEGRNIYICSSYEEIQIAVHSIIEAVKYILEIGMSFVLTELFNQDVLEEYFARHISLWL